MIVKLHQPKSGLLLLLGWMNFLAHPKKHWQMNTRKYLLYLNMDFYWWLPTTWGTYITLLAPSSTGNACPHWTTFVWFVTDLMYLLTETCWNRLCALGNCAASVFNNLVLEQVTAFSVWLTSLQMLQMILQLLQKWWISLSALLPLPPSPLGTTWSLIRIHLFSTPKIQRKLYFLRITKLKVAVWNLMYLLGL